MGTRDLDGVAVKAIHDEVLSSLDKHLNEHFKRIETDIALRIGKSVGDIARQDLASYVDAQLAGIKQFVREEISKIKHLVGSGRKELIELVKALPRPEVVVQVPDGAIKIKQVPSQVTVNVPEKALNLTLAARPKRKMVEKSIIEYSQQTGRPEIVTKEITEEDEV